MTPATPWTEMSVGATPYTEMTGGPGDAFILFLLETSGIQPTSYTEMSVAATSYTELTAPSTSWTEITL